MAFKRTGWFAVQAGGRHGSLLLVAFSVLAAVLGACLGADAHSADGGARTDPCDFEPASIKAGAERVPSPDRTAPALTPSIADVTVVMHCGTPAAPPTVIAVAAFSVRPYVPRAPPHG